MNQYLKLTDPNTIEAVHELLNSNNIPFESSPSSCKFRHDEIMESMREGFEDLDEERMSEAIYQVSEDYYLIVEAYQCEEY